MPIPFPPGKTIKELGIDTTRKFVVVKGDEEPYSEGDILVLEYDDNSCSPKFKRLSDNLGAFEILSNLAYADEPEEKKEPYVPRVGDRVSVEGTVTSVHDIAFCVSLDGCVKEQVTLGNFALRSTKLLSRTSRTLTKSEAEALLKEKLGEDVTIEL